MSISLCIPFVWHPLLPAISDPKTISKEKPQWGVAVSLQAPHCDSQNKALLCRVNVNSAEFCGTQRGGNCAPRGTSLGQRQDRIGRPRRPSLALQGPSAQLAPSPAGPSAEAGQSRLAPGGRGLCRGWNVSADCQF